MFEGNVGTPAGNVLAYREQGQGPPVILLHEFAGSMDAWNEQVPALAARYRTVVYAARGYPPSSAPRIENDYSQAAAVDDLRDLLDRLDIRNAVLVGLSMGGTTAISFAIRYPERVAALVVASAGSGSDDRSAFVADFAGLAGRIETEGSAAFADTYLRGPTRLPLKSKRPAVWLELRNRLAATPAATLAGTIRGVMLRRTPVYELEPELRKVTSPALIMIGDLDHPVLRAGGFLAACLRASELFVLRDTGHTVNLEEPAIFNSALLCFLAGIHDERWG